MIDRRQVLVGTAAAILSPMVAGPATHATEAGDMPSVAPAAAGAPRIALIISDNEAQIRDGLCFYKDFGYTPVVMNTIEDAQSYLRENAEHVGSMLFEGDDLRKVWLPFARQDMERYGHIGVIRFDTNT